MVSQGAQWRTRRSEWLASLLALFGFRLAQKVTPQSDTLETSRSPTFDKPVQVCQSPPDGRYPEIGIRTKTAAVFGGAFVVAMLAGRAFFIDSQRPVPLSLAGVAQNRK